MYIPSLIANGVMSFVGVATTVSLIVSVLKPYLEKSFIPTKSSLHDPFFMTLPLVLSFGFMFIGSALLGVLAAHVLIIVIESILAWLIAIGVYKISNGGKLQSPFGPLVTVTQGQIAQFESNAQLAPVIELLVSLGVIAVIPGAAVTPPPPKRSLRQRLIVLLGGTVPEPEPGRITPVKVTGRSYTSES